MRAVMNRPRVGRSIFLSATAIACAAASIAACSLNLDDLTGGQMDSDAQVGDAGVKIIYVTPDATTMDATTQNDGAIDSGSDAADSDGASDAAASADGDADLPDARSPYASAVLADSPVAYWPMDDQANSITAVDIVGGHTATITGTSVTFGQTGAVGTAARLDGNSALSPGAFFDLYGRQPFAIEMWVEPDNPALTSTTDGGTIFENIASEHGSDGAGYVFYLRTGPQVQFEESWPGDQGTGRNCWKSYAKPTDFEHVVVTLDASNMIHIFANGVEATAATEFTVDGGPTTDGGVTTLGSSLDGLLDEVAFYTHQLTADRVAAHFSARTP